MRAELDSPRDHRLDALRGVLLMLMTGTHVPTPLSEWTHAPLGFSGSAEGFVLLSAYFVGLLTNRKVRRGGPAGASRWLWRRARHVYACHVSVLVTTAIAASLLSPRLQTLRNQFGSLVAEPTRAWLQIPALLYQPPLFDILPMYVAFLCVTPAVLWTLRRYGWLPVLVASAVLWLIAQCGATTLHLRVWLKSVGLTLGHFDLFAWQILWVAGVALGFQPAPSVLRRWRGRPLALAIAAGLACALAALRYSAPHFDASATVVQRLTDKWTLGPLRALNLAALTFLLICWNPTPPGWLLGAPAVLGRHSLAVFCAHLPIVIAGTVAVESFAWSRVGAAMVGATCIVVLFAPALWLDRRQRRGSAAGGACSTARSNQACRSVLGLR